MTEKQWDAHPSLQQDLAAILANPVVVAALDILVTKAMTHVPVPAGANLIHWQAMIGSKREGCFETLAFLRQLATPAAQQVPGRKPWASEPEQPGANKAPAK